MTTLATQEGLFQIPGTSIWVPDPTMDVPAWVDDLDIRIVFVTPEMARRWLDKHNTRNRKASKTVIARYETEMRGEDWTIAPDMIAFYAIEEIAGAVEALENGQQRLKAIANTGIGQWFIVGWGFPDIAGAATDTGRRRNAKDLYELNGIHLTQPQVGAVRAIEILRRLMAGTMASWNDNRNGPSIARTYEVGLELLTALEEYGTWSIASRMSNKACHARAPFHVAGAVHYLLCEQYGVETVTAFFERIMTPTELGEFDPRWRLHYLFSGQRGATGEKKWGPGKYAQLLIRGFNFLMDGVSVKEIRYEEDSWPKIGQRSSTTARRAHALRLARQAATAAGGG